MNLVEKRVANGVAWLDKNVYDWVDKVNLNEFDMGSACRCVLGGVFAPESSACRSGSVSGESGYGYALNRFVRKGEWSSYNNDSWAVNHGFNHDKFHSYDELEREWVRVIEQRKALWRQHRLAIEAFESQRVTVST